MLPLIYLVQDMIGAYGLSAHPTDNNVLYYVSSWRRHSIKKFTLNSSKTSYTENASKGQCCNGTSNASRQYIYYGRGLGLDSTNNRLAIGSYYGSQVHAFDFNLTSLKLLVLLQNREWMELMKQ